MVPVVTGSGSGVTGRHPEKKESRIREDKNNKMKKKVRFGILVFLFFKNIFFYSKNYLRQGDVLSNAR